MVMVVPHPTKFQQIKSAAIAATDFAKSGFKTADPQLADQRQSICKTCQHWDQNGFGGSGKCKKCGCSTWAKLRMLSSKCPDARW